MEAARGSSPAPGYVRHLPLHEVTERYGTLGLYTRFEDSLKTYDLDKSPEVQWALQMGMTLHANDRRSNGHYEDHILRVTLRIIDHFDITDPVVVAASLLHDSVEDHPKDLVLALTGEKMTDVREARKKSLELIAEHTDPETADIVAAVTCPVLEEGQNRITLYGDHTEELVLNHPKARVVKLSDFIDNAVGNHYTVGDKQQKLDEKYLDQYRIHRMGLYLPDSMITGETRTQILRQLARAHARALARLAVAPSLAT